MKSLAVVLAGLAALPAFADPSFLFPTTIKLGSNIVSIAAGDFNNDGFGDFVVSCSAGTYTLFLGSSDGSLTRKEIPTIAPNAFPNPLTGYASVMAVADVNRDGKLDIITDAGVALGNGDGTFQTLIPFSSSPGAAIKIEPLEVTLLMTNASNVIEVADFNNDGIPDICIGASAVRLGHGDGTFGPPISTLPLFPDEDPFSDELVVFTLGDFDGDGYVDIAYDGWQAGIFILFGNGDGTFTRRGGAPGSLPFAGSLVAGDLIGDGKVDLVDAASGTIGIMLNEGNGSFRTVSSYPTLSSSLTGHNGPLAVADFDGDEKKDIASYFYVYPGNGDGTLRTPIAFGQMPVLTTLIPSVLIPYDSPPLVVADVNGDGRPDLIGVGPTLDAFNVLLNSSGKPVASAPAFLAAGGAPGLAPGAIATIYGAGFSAITAPAEVPLPATIGNTSVEVVDPAGNVFQAPLLYVSPSQINFQVPDGVALGSAIINIVGNGLPRGAHSTAVQEVAAGIFTLDGSGSGAPVASAVRVAPDGTQTPVATDQPILVDSNSQVYLSLYGTGFRHATSGTCSFGLSTSFFATEVDSPASYFGPQSPTSLIDQVNIPIPADTPKGSVDAFCYFSGGLGSITNRVTIKVR